jgi:hypothetical protein
MKKLFLIFIFSSLFAKAQRIQNFNLSLTNGTVVTARFVMSAGTTCNGFNVLYCIDSLNYYPIYNYQGVCGSTTKAESYTYDHYTPAFDLVNYYKIELPGIETSPPQRIYVPSSPKVNMLLYPNPLYTNSDLLNAKIFNAANTRFVGYIYSRFGVAIRELDFTTVGDMTSIGVFDLENGLYLLWLTDGFVAYQSKFIIIR